MKYRFDVPGQTFFRGMKPTPRPPPSPEEIARALDRGARDAISRWHRGCAPEECDFSFESFLSEVQMRALQRVKIFRHGGRFSLDEFAHVACYQALRDIQRQSIKRLKLQKMETKSYPLFDEGRSGLKEDFE